jgi:hypothetical protein
MVWVMPCSAFLPGRDGFGLPGELLHGNPTIGDHLEDRARVQLPYTAAKTAVTLGTWPGLSCFWRAGIALFPSAKPRIFAIKSNSILGACVKYRGVFSYLR